MEIQIIGDYIRHFYDGGSHVAVVYVVVASMLDDVVFDVACYMKGYCVPSDRDMNKRFYIEDTKAIGDKISKQEAVALFPGIAKYTYRY